MGLGWGIDFRAGPDGLTLSLGGHGMRLGFWLSGQAGVGSRSSLGGQGEGLRLGIATNIGDFLRRSGLRSVAGRWPGSRAQAGGPGGELVAVQGSESRGLDEHLCPRLWADVCG